MMEIVRPPATNHPSSMLPPFQQFLSPVAIASYARELDPAGNMESEEKLGKLTLTDLFGDVVVRDPMMAECCRSGLWLLHNFLHESHEISQSIDSPEGSWWHAIMHRTEGDFSNAKYWYRRVGEHQAMNSIEIEASGSRFDPYDFVDMCQKDYRDGSLSDATQKIAVQEWKALFNHCFECSM